MDAINDEVLGAVEILSEFSEEFTKLPCRETQIRFTKTGILKAVDILFEFIADERRQISSVYNARQKAWMDRQSQFYGYFKAGKTESKVEAASNLKSLGVSTDIIIQSTGLSSEEIVKL